MGEQVFKTLGLWESWPLRGVCRRWRRLVEGTEWAKLELQLKERKAEGLFDSAAALVEKGKLQLSAGASIVLGSELSKHFDLEFRTVEAAARLLAAITRGRQQQR
eukprot:tig00000269_g23708.t1